MADFVNVLNIGLGTDVFNAQMDFEEVKFRIMKQAYYQDITNTIKLQNSEVWQEITETNSKGSCAIGQYFTS